MRECSSGYRTSSGRNLTKSPPPLIIFMGLGQMRPLGVGATSQTARLGQRSKDMRITLYRNDDRTVDVLVQPGPGRGLPPVLLPRVKVADLEARIAPEIARVKRQDPPTTVV